VLTEIAKEDINLSKLQSVPIPEQGWKYSFHADMEFDSIDRYERVMQKIKPITESLTVLGVYQKGKTID